jgi:hypothetical protein
MTMSEEDDRTPEELEEDLAAESHERIRLAITGKTYTLEEVLERSKQRLTELSALKPNF